MKNYILVLRNALLLAIAVSATAHEPSIPIGIKAYGGIDSPEWIYETCVVPDGVFATIQTGNDSNGFIYINDSYFPLSRNFPIHIPANTAIKIPVSRGFYLVTFYSGKQEAVVHEPSQSIVIPETASGPFTVSIECSSDLIKWTEIVPGRHTLDSGKRFFRIRLVMD